MIRDDFEYPEELQKKLKRATTLEWISIFMIGSIIVLMSVTLSGSQAMKAAWIEDLLSLIPPITVLIASKLRDREPDEKYQYGFHRSVSIAFLCGAVALTMMGAFISYESFMTLFRQEHPSIGMIELFGREIWLGWVMIAVLIYSGVIPVLLGRMKLPLARALHDKALHADADMNRADWMTALGGVLGIVGIAFGLWWADGVAAAFISVAILRDGLLNLKRVIEDLMDTSPSTVDGDDDRSAEAVEARLKANDVIRDAYVRVREEGHVFAGEIYIETSEMTSTELVRLARDVRREAAKVDWRYFDLTVMPVESVTAIRPRKRNE